MEAPMLKIGCKTKLSYIIELVSRECGLTKEMLYNKSRKREIVYARQLVWYYAHMTTKETLSSLGRIFNKDHATVLYGIRNIKNQIEVGYDNVVELNNKVRPHLKYWIDVKSKEEQLQS